MHTFTLVQKAVDLEEYQNMILKRQLPLVIKLTEQVEEEKKEFSMTPFSDLYQRAFPMDGVVYQFLNDNYLREAIEQKKIFIPEFIDLEGKTKYVDYITLSHSLDSGGYLVFRNTKRFFKGSQSRYSLQKNHEPFHRELVQMSIGGTTEMVPMFLAPSPKHKEESEELFQLCSDILYYSNPETKEPAPQKKIQVS